MLYCSNPSCVNPFIANGNKFCTSCGFSQLSTLFHNRYRVIRLLGKGGFGRTYEARDVDRMDDPCVIKQFSPQFLGTAALETATQLFKQEAKRLYDLGEHPQIPSLIAYFEQDKRLYLVQELVVGQTLLQELQQEGTFNEKKIRQLLTDLLPVLQLIHDRAIIHRDIKPDNIMRRSHNRQLVLIDFGVSKVVTETPVSEGGTRVGTSGYAPIEQMRGQVVPASDLYSLGITCLRLLTGDLPQSDSCDPLYDAINGRWQWHQRIPKGTEISFQLTQVLDKLTQEYVKDRYTTAKEVLQALDATASPTSPVSSVADPLHSNLGLDYRQLQEFLQAGRWREADLVTKSLIQTILQVSQQGNSNFCKDFYVLNYLWVKYSNGRFGFSVQRKIWKKCGGDVEKFGNFVGWYNNNSWLLEKRLDFSLNAPVGHLPVQHYVVKEVVCFWLVGFSSISELFTQCETKTSSTSPKKSALLNSNENNPQGNSSLSSEKSANPTLSSPLPIEVSEENFVTKTKKIFGILKNLGNKEK